MGTCCSKDCCPTQSMKNSWTNGLVPPAYNVGYVYNDTDPSEPCCKCVFTDDLCRSINSSYPHAAADCGPCQCSPSKVMTQRAAINNCLKPVDPVSLRCPPDKPKWVPGSEPDGCKCICDKSPADCAPYETFRPEFCRCVCEKALIKCDGGDPCDSKPFLENPTPNYHAEDCSCKCDLDPANGGPGCAGNQRKPDFNKATCQCECKYDIGTEKCPPNLPFIDPKVCMCVCPYTIMESCKKDEIFDPDTCSCKPCPIPCKGSRTRKPGSCECECRKTTSDCPPDRPVLDDVSCECYCPIAIQMGCTGPHKRFNINKCECVYDTSKLSISLEP